MCSHFQRLSNYLFSFYCEKRLHIFYFDSLRPSLQCVSHVGRGLTGLNQYNAEDKVSCSRTQHSAFVRARHATLDLKSSILPLTLLMNAKENNSCLLTFGTHAEPLLRCRRPYCAAIVTLRRPHCALVRRPSDDVCF